MKSVIAWIVLALPLAIASGCGGAPAEKREDAQASPASGGSAALPGQVATRSAGVKEPKIPVSAKTRESRGPDAEAREHARAQSATRLGVAVDEIGTRANHATALLEVSIGTDPNSIMRTGTAFCVDTTGLFITHADVVKGVTEDRGQVRMLFGDRKEPRTAVYPKIVRIDDETNIASLRIEPDPELPLVALAPARSADLSAGATVVVLAFPWGRHHESYDSKGKLVKGPKFDFTYFGGWAKEPPDHLIIPLEVRNVWREDGRPSAFDLVEGAQFREISSGSPALNAAGEVVGILIRPDSRANETITIRRSRDGVVVSSDAPAPFMGALSAEHLSRFLGGGRRPGDLAGAAIETNRLAMMRTGKKATALVEVSTRAGECSGTAFCIDPSGLFITNAHVVEDTIKDSRYVVNLVMDVGLPTQRAHRAEVVHVDQKVDLALLKTESDSRLEALELGADGDAIPTMLITTFGFPFGKRLAGATGAPTSSYPDVAVNSSRITALGPAVRFDGQLNPGNSGGPVVSSRGNVLGVARATVLGASINFAIPVGQLREFLAKPGLLVRTTPVAFEDRARPTTWTFQVVPSRWTTMPENLAVSVTVPDGANPSRRLWAETAPGTAAGAFRLEFVPMPRDPGRAVALDIGFGDHIERAAVEDRDITIGGRKFRLGAVRHLVMRPDPWAFVTDEPVGRGPILGPGEVVKGPIGGLGKVMAVEGAARKAIDLGAASEFTVAGVAPVPAAQLDAVIRVYKGGKQGTVVCDSRTRLQISGAQAPGTVRQTEKTPRLRPPSEEIETILALITRTMPKNARTDRLRLDDKDRRIQLGGELYVSGVARGASKAIRPPRVAIGKALAADASEAGLGTRVLDVPAAPSDASQPMFALPNPYQRTVVRFSQDGSRLALGLHESIRIYDARGGRLIKELNQPDATLLAFTANNAKLVAYSASHPDHRQPGRFVNVPARGPLVWDLKTGTTASAPRIPGSERVPLHWISSDGRLVATGRFQCWDLQSGKKRASILIEDDQLRPLATNPVVTADGRRLLSFYAPRRQDPRNNAAASKIGRRAPGQAAAAPLQSREAVSLRVHDIDTGRLLFDMDFAGMTFVGLVSGTDTCVCEVANSTISVRDLKTGKELRRATLRPTSPSRDASQSVAAAGSPAGTPQLTPDGKQLVKPVLDGGFVVFDLASGAEVARYKSSETGRTAPAETLVLAPSGRTAAVYSRRDVHLWTLPDPTAARAKVAARKPEAPPLERKLAATATAIAVGGAGRYLLLTLDHARQLAIFDTNAADVVKTVPLASDQALVAAGATKFVIAYPEAKRIERWDFGTMTRDGDPAAVPFEGTLEAIAMGADSEGPLLATWWFPHGNPAVKDLKNNRLSFLDLTKFKVLAVSLIALHGTANTAARLAASGGDFQFVHGGWIGKTRLRASYDGSLFGVCRTEDGRSGVELALKADAGALWVSHDIGVQFDAPAYMIPSPDGRRVFHGKTGIRDAVFVETPIQSRNNPRLDEKRLLRVPSTDPRLDISLRTADTITFLHAEDGTRLLTVAGLDEMTGVLQQGGIVRNGISLENRYHLVPAAKLLVTIPPSNDRLVMRRLEIDP